MSGIEELIEDGLLGYALGRLTAMDTVSRPLLAAAFDRLVEVSPPDDLMVGFQDALAVEAWKALYASLAFDRAAGTLDLRQLHRDGWTVPKRAHAMFLADLLSCPICVSFHALWLSRLVTGRFRPWSTRWWVRLFAGWAAAQVLLRLPSHGDAKDASMYLSEALTRAQNQEA